MEMEEERRARLEKVVATTHLKLALETEEERREWIGLDLDLIWIEIAVKLQGMSSRNELARPVMGTIFLVKMMSI